MNPTTESITMGMTISGRMIISILVWMLASRHQCRLSAAIRDSLWMLGSGHRAAQCFLLASHGHGGTHDSINLHRLLEVFQAFVAKSLHTIAVAQASCGLWADQELAGLGSG